MKTPKRLKSRQHKAKPAYAGCFQKTKRDSVPHRVPFEIFVFWGFGILGFLDFGFGFWNLGF
ncbi:MAG: hypothetical protein AABZ78_17475 [Chloroflexota bacterium]